MFEVDPLWPKPLPNHWLLGIDHRRVGRRAGPRLDHPPRRRRRCTTTREALELNPPIGECCARAPPVLEFDPGRQPRAALGRPGPGLRVAGVEPRHPRRLQGQRLDRRQRREGRAHPEVHQGRQVPDAGRPSGKNAGSNDPENFGRVAKIWVDPKTNEAYVADGYGNKRVAVLDADTGKIKRYWGAYGNKPDDTDLGPYDPDGAAARSSSATRCTAPSSRTTGSSTSATVERPHAGLQARRHVREGGVLREEHAGRRLGLGHRVLEGPAAALHLPGRRREREGPHHRCARRSRS